MVWRQRITGRLCRHHSDGLARSRVFERLFRSMRDESRDLQHLPWQKQDGDAAPLFGLLRGDIQHIIRQIIEKKRPLGKAGA